MKFKCIWCKTRFDFDADNKERGFKKMIEFFIHAKTTHGFSMEIINKYYEEWLKQKKLKEEIK